MKKLISAAIAAVVATPVVAAADVTLYGKFHESLDYVDAASSVWQLNSRASRWGIKGSEDLGNGLKAIFQMESTVDVADGGGIDAGPRNTYIGFAGDFGTALAGVHDTPYKIGIGKVDKFGDTAGDFNTLFNDERAPNAIAYISPNFSGFTVAAAGIPGEGLGANGQLDDLVNNYSIALMYKNSGFWGSAAYEDLTVVHAAALGSPEEKWAIAGGYAADGFSVNAIYANQQWDSTGEDQDLWLVSAGYKFGNNEVKAQYGDRDSDVAANDRSQWTIGLDHSFSKRTKAYVLYTNQDNPGVDVDTFSLGAVHSF